MIRLIIARVVAESVHGAFQRIQCTPDLLPSDIIGTQVYETATNSFVTQLGPVHANIVLLDEINRSSAKTQSAMLEAMEERQTTIAGQVYPIPEPFLVIATQNPVDQEGTYPLSEAQTDRFLLKDVVNYPTPDEEVEVLARIDRKGLATRCREAGDEGEFDDAQPARGERDGGEQPGEGEDRERLGPRDGVGVDAAEAQGEQQDHEDEPDEIAGELRQAELVPDELAVHDGDQGHQQQHGGVQVDRDTEQPADGEAGPPVGAASRSRVSLHRLRCYGTSRRVDPPVRPGWRRTIGAGTHTGAAGPGSAVPVTGFGRTRDIAFRT